MSTHVFPKDFFWGHRHLVVDRGRVERGRQRPFDLGHVRPHAGQDQERRHPRRTRLAVSFNNRNILSDKG